MNGTSAILAHIHMTQVNRMSNPKGNVENLKHFAAKWKSGKTQTIRVPVTLAEEVMTIARQLDEGKTVLVEDDSYLKSIPSQMVLLKLQTTRLKSELESVNNNHLKLIEQHNKLSDKVKNILTLIRCPVLDGKGNKAKSNNAVPYRDRIAKIEKVITE